MAGKGIAKWDPWKMFDVTEEEKMVIEKRAKMRQALKFEWQRKLYTPNHQPNPSGGSGHMFDPQVQRYISLRRTQWDYFKELKKKPKIPLFFLILVPVFLTAIQSYEQREYTNKAMASGHMTYKDRVSRFQSW